MSLRSNYAIEDFMLFSDRVYDRMFELHNMALWPLHLLAAAIAVLLVAVALKPSPGKVRLAYGALSLVWFFVAGAFLYARYAPINWAALYAVPVFVIMALILAGFAVRANPPDLTGRRSLSAMVALGVLVLSLVGYPLISLASGTSWYAVQVFAIAPDPTATATLAFLALSRGRGVLAAMLIPSLWAVLAGLTLYALGRGEFVVAPLAAAACLAAAIAGRWHAALPERSSRP
jgi:hypothetical protein